MTRAGKGFWLTTSDYHTVNLTGTWKHIFLETGEVRELPPGSYVFQPGGEMHGDAFIGPEDCVIMLRSGCRRFSHAGAVDRRRREIGLPALPPSEQLAREAAVPRGQFA